MTHGSMGRKKFPKRVLSCNPRCPCWAIGSVLIGGAPHLMDFREAKISCFKLVTCSTRSLAARWLRKVIRCANQVMSNGTFYIRPLLKGRCAWFLGGSGFWQFQNHRRPKKWCFNPLSKVGSYATCLFLPLHRFNLESCGFGRLNQSIFEKIGVWRTFAQTHTRFSYSNSINILISFCIFQAKDIRSGPHRKPLIDPPYVLVFWLIVLHDHRQKACFWLFTCDIM